MLKFPLRGRKWTETIFLKQKISHACEIAINSSTADNDEKLFIDSIKHAIINGTIDCSNLLPFLNDFKESPVLAILKTDIADAIQASYKVCKD